MNQQINEEAFRNGDEREFEKIVNMLNRELFYFAKNIIEDIQEAEDIVLISFTKLFERCQNFDTLSNIRAFLYITVRNRCINKLKRRKVRSKHEKELAYLTWEDQVPIILKDTIEADLLQRLMKAADLLPETCREIFRLHYFEGMTIPDIAAKLDKSTRNVTTQLFYGRESLRKLLDATNPKSR